MYAVRVLTPFISFQYQLKQNAFSVLALSYIRDKSYFRFLPPKKFYQKHHK
jgi:hypothetical protein